MKQSAAAFLATLKSCLEAPDGRWRAAKLCLPVGGGAAGR